MVNGSSIFSESPKMVDTDLAKHARTASSSCGLLLDFRDRGVATPYRRPARPARHGCRPGLPKGSGSVAGHLGRTYKERLKCPHCGLNGMKQANRLAAAATT